MRNGGLVGLSDRLLESLLRLVKLEFFRCREVMSDLFYQSIKSQDNLELVFPERNHPISGSPTKVAIEIIRLYRKGMAPKDIAVMLNKSLNSIEGVIRRSGLYVQRIKRTKYRTKGVYPSLQVPVTVVKDGVG